MTEIFLKAYITSFIVFMVSWLLLINQRKTKNFNLIMLLGFSRAIGGGVCLASAIGIIWSL